MTRASKPASGPIRGGRPSERCGGPTVGGPQDAQGRAAGGGFAAWQLGLIGVHAVRAALDAGCGEGRMTAELRHQMSPAGMLVALDVAREAVRAAARLSRAGGVRGDIGALPFPNGAFDLVLAGHVLYYAADIRSWARELRRVLDAGGVLLVSANSATSARRLLTFHVRACRHARLDTMAQRALAPTGRDRFTLENGAAHLGREFSRVEVHARDDPLVLENVEAALRLYRSGPHTRGAGPLRSAGEVRSLADVLTPHMRAILGAAAEADGTIVIPRRSGCFVARH